MKGAAIGRAPEHGPQYGEVLTDDSCYTLTTNEVHAVCVAPPLTARYGKGVQSDADDAIIAGPVSANEGATYSHGGNNAGRLHNVVSVVHSDAIGRDGIAREPSPDAEGNVRLRDAGLGVIEDESYALTTGAPHAVASFDLAQITSKTNRSTVKPGAPSSTLAATGQMHVADEVALRRLTPRECERLQGLPDDWTLIDGATDTARYRVIGNGVAVPVIEWIGRRLAAA